MINQTRIILLIALLTAQTNLLSQRYSVVIDELMADPSPQVGLPASEWVELKNTRSSPINLLGWKLSDASNSSGPMPAFVLQPDSLVIVCATGSIAALQPFGPTIAVSSFPSLDNDRDRLSLNDASGNIIHAVAYSGSWYQNELKKNGGWTLEMIDTNNPCMGVANWKSSIAAAGGTPGKKNSVTAVVNDDSSPQLRRAYVKDSVTIILVFDEPVDSLKGSISTNYTLDDGIAIVEAIPVAPLFDEVLLRLSTPIIANKIYTINTNNITDCKNNVIGSFNKTRVGLPVDPLPGDLVINEILFNPRSNGNDYVEIYNKSNKIFDASNLYMANRDAGNTISSIVPIVAMSWLVFPEDHIVITEDADNLGLNYLVRYPDLVFSPASMPSYPDDKGYVLILDAQGKVLDEVNYVDDWHFKLIENSEGVSLERVDPASTSNDPVSWHSAASTVGYGTPTYKNSQLRQEPAIAATIEIAPKVFSPDNDGFDDIATIQYKIDEPGYVANITIFDAAGRPVRNLVRNATLALSGYWNWDGLDDKSNKLAVGPYIIFTEIFNLQGKKNRFKSTVVLARKFN